MFCPNCGEQLEGTPQFCSRCGGPVKMTAGGNGFGAGAPGQEGSAWQPNWQQNPQKSGFQMPGAEQGNLIIRIVAGIMALICLYFCIPGLFSIVRYFFSNVRYFFFIGGAFRGMMYLIGTVIGLACNLLMLMIALTCGLIAFDFETGEQNEFFSIIGLSAAAFVILSLLRILIGKIYQSHIPISALFAIFGKQVLWVLAAAVILFGLFAFFAQMPLVGMNLEGMKLILAGLPAFIKEKFAGISEKMSSMNANRTAQNAYHQTNVPPNMNQNSFGGMNGGFNMNQGPDMNQGPNMQQNMNMNQGYYGGPGPQSMVHVPLDENRALWKYIIFGILTCGIYQLVFLYGYARDINIVCQGDNRETAGFWKMFLLTIVTCGIYYYIWLYNVGDRLWANGQRYNMGFTENGGTLLLWYLFGIMLCGIGPFIAINIMIRNLNALCHVYNQQISGPAM